MLAYLDSHPIQWVVIEKSDRVLSNKDLPEFNALKRAFELRGYIVHGVIIETSEYSLPQHRRRLWIVGIHRAGTASSTFRVRSPQRIYNDFDTSLNSLRQLPPSVEQIIVDDANPIVEKVLPEKQVAASSARRSPMTAKTADLALKLCRQRGRAWSHLTPTSTSPWLD